MSADNLKELAINYFTAWNNHDINEVIACFNIDGILRDWDISASGLDEIKTANMNIFNAVPDIKADILTITTSNNIAACELLIHLNNEDKSVLKVVDIIEFKDGKIKALRAYKG